MILVGIGGPLCGVRSVEVTYIANEGVLLSAGGRKVLIDGLHREYRNYPHLPEPHRGTLETAQPPFDSVDLILVSHVHLDHFHTEAIGRYLAHDGKAMLVSSEQVVGELEKGVADYASIRSRVTAVTPPLTQKVSMTAGGIEIDVMGVGHGSGRHREIQNLGHIVRLGGKTFLHVGDAEADREIFAKLNLDAEGIDVAFLPMWLLIGTDGPRSCGNTSSPGISSPSTCLRTAPSALHERSGTSSPRRMPSRSCWSAGCIDAGPVGVIAVERVSSGVLHFRSTPEVCT